MVSREGKGNGSEFLSSSALNDENRLSAFRCAFRKAFFAEQEQVLSGGFRGNAEFLFPCIYCDRGMTAFQNPAGAFQLTLIECSLFLKSGYHFVRADVTEELLFHPFYAAFHHRGIEINEIGHVPVRFFHRAHGLVIAASLFRNDAGNAEITEEIVSGL